MNDKELDELQVELTLRAGVAKINEQFITEALHIKARDAIIELRDNSSVSALEITLRRIAFDGLSYSLMAEIARDALVGVEGIIDDIKDGEDYGGII